MENFEGQSISHTEEHLGFMSKARFEYLTPRIRITPFDLESTPLAAPNYLHFICSPERASSILVEIDQISHRTPWKPICIYEPIPVSYPFLVPEVLNRPVMLGSMRAGRTPRSSKNCTPDKCTEVDRLPECCPTTAHI